jgi:ATP-dependent Clp protease adaptor protein ClpS
MDLSSTDVETNTSIKEPSKYGVFLINDNYTHWEFVVQTLIEIFNKSESEAQEITSNVHHNDSGLCGIFSKEIAETKVDETKEFSILNKQQLQTIMKKIN